MWFRKWCKPSFWALCCSAPTGGMSLLLVAFMPIIFGGGGGLSRAGAARDQTRHESHGRCERRHQGNHQRHFDCEKFSAGRKHLRLVRRIKPAVVSSQHSARICALAGLPHAQRALGHFRRHPDLCGRHERGSRDWSASARGICSS